MRFAALLHDAAKPQTRGVRPDGRVTFIGHDEVGAGLARDVLRRLRASQRTIDYVAALTLHHLRLGFLVHRQPLDRRARSGATCAPPRRGPTTSRSSPSPTGWPRAGATPSEAITAHVALARDMLAAAPRRRPSR